jgi:hypothetical protein
MNRREKIEAVVYERLRYCHDLDAPEYYADKIAGDIEDLLHNPQSDIWKQYHEEKK